GRAGGNDRISQKATSFLSAKSGNQFSLKLQRLCFSQFISEDSSDDNVPRSLNFSDSFAFTRLIHAQCVVPCPVTRALADVERFSGGSAWILQCVDVVRIHIWDGASAV